MTPTAATPWARDTRKKTGITIGGGPEPPNRHPVVMPINKVLSAVSQPEINRTHAVIVARALNMSGIFSPPANSVVQVYTVIVSCQDRWTHI
jgi:hypothetical protein